MLRSSSSWSLINAIYNHARFDYYYLSRLTYGFELITTCARAFFTFRGFVLKSHLLFNVTLLRASCWKDGYGMSFFWQSFVCSRSVFWISQLKYTIVRTEKNKPDFVDSILFGLSLLGGTVSTGLCWTASSGALKEVTRFQYELGNCELSLFKNLVQPHQFRGILR